VLKGRAGVKIRIAYLLMDGCVICWHWTKICF